MIDADTHRESTHPSGRCDGTLTDVEAAKLLLDSWKFRQSHAWSSLTRYFLAAVAVSVVPYVMKDDLTHQLEGALLAFPIVGGMLALGAVWLYAAEYIRSQAMNRRFREILQSYGFYSTVELRRFERVVLRPKIGWTTVYVLAVSTVLLEGVNIWIVGSTLV
jgi:hypothetical protein